MTTPAVKTAMAKTPNQNPTTSVRGAEGPPGLGSSTSRRPADLRLFGPQLLTSCGSGPMVRESKAVYYRKKSVERIMDMAATKGDDVVRTNLNTCLHGAAKTWYTIPLTSLERKALRRGLGDSMDQWTALDDNYRPIHTITFDNLLAERSRVSDGRGQKEPSQYLLNVMSHAKYAWFEVICDQEHFTFGNIDVLMIGTTGSGRNSNDARNSSGQGRDLRSPNIQSCRSHPDSPQRYQNVGDYHSQHHGQHYSRNYGQTYQNAYSSLQHQKCPIYQLERKSRRNPAALPPANNQQTSSRVKQVRFAA